MYIDQSRLIDRRLTEQLLRYWLKIRGPRPFPLENEIDPGAMGEGWQNCFMVKITDAPKLNGFRYVYLGKALFDAYGGDVTDETAESLISLSSTRVREKFDEILNIRKPLLDEGEFKNSAKVTIKYRQILLPIGHPKSGPNNWQLSYILGGMRWKYF